MSYIPTKNNIFQTKLRLKIGQNAEKPRAKFRDDSGMFALIFYFYKNYGFHVNIVEEEFSAPITKTTEPVVYKFIN